MKCYVKAELVLPLQSLLWNLFVPAMLSLLYHSLSLFLKTRFRAQDAFIYR